KKSYHSMDVPTVLATTARRRAVRTVSSLSVFAVIAAPPVDPLWKLGPAVVNRRTAECGGWSPTGVGRHANELTTADGPTAGDRSLSVARRGAGTRRSERWSTRRGGGPSGSRPERLPLPRHQQCVGGRCPQALF